MTLPPPSPPSGFPPPGGVPAAAPEPSPTSPWWKRWWAIALAAVLVLALVSTIAAVAATSDDDDSVTGAPDATPESTVATLPTTEATESTAPETSASPETSESPAETTTPATDAPAVDPGIGDTIALDDGGSARVIALTPNAPPRRELFPPDPGFTFTEADVEQCAGSDRLSINPLYWKAFLTDNTEAEVSILSNDMQTFDMAPGGCSRGWVAFSVPDGATIADVVLTSALFSEIGRWTAETTVPVSGPLASGTEVESAALGETVELEGGATAVVRSITPNAAPTNELFPAAAGRQLVDADVELCAGTEPLSVNPLYWLMTAQDNYTGGASLGGGTLPTIDVAAGQCAAGIVQFDMLEQSVPAYVVFTGTLFEELARWSE
jgi:hypothetical protein